MMVTEGEQFVFGGVDTHKDQHTVSALDSRGSSLGHAEFEASPAGYRALLSWLRAHGCVLRVGIEATGSYGAGLTRYLRSQDVEVREVVPPKKRTLRGRNKSDPLDAEAAARAVVAECATGTPKSADGPVEVLRMIRVARSSAIKARTQTANQLHALVETAPAGLRERLRTHKIARLVSEVRRWRPGQIVDPPSACRRTLFLLAKRWEQLDDEIRSYDSELERSDS